MQQRLIIVLITIPGKRQNHVNTDIDYDIDINLDYFIRLIIVNYLKKHFSCVTTRDVDILG